MKYEVWLVSRGRGIYTPRPLYKYHVLCSLTMLHTSYPAYEDGTDRVFRNVGIQQYPKEYIQDWDGLHHVACDYRSNKEVSKSLASLVLPSLI